MRRPLAISSGVVLLVLLCGAGLTLAPRDDSIPPGAINVRVDHQSMSRTYVNYDLPPGWLLLDLYDYLAERGWERDVTTERSLQRSWTADVNRIFAIFVRQSLFGMVPEVAIVGIAPDNPQVHVRLWRCFRVDMRIRCP